MAMIFSSNIRYEHYFLIYLALQLGSYCILLNAISFALSFSSELYRPVDVLYGRNVFHSDLWLVIVGKLILEYATRMAISFEFRS